MSKAVVAGMGVAVLLGVAYVGATAWLGLRIEDGHAQQLARLQAQFPFVQITGQGYERGFFSSRSAIALEVGCGSDDGSPPATVVLRSLIRHGPLPGWLTFGAAAIDSELQLPAATQAAVDQAFKGAVPLTIRTVVGYMGGFTTELHSPPAQIPGRAGQSLAWQGATATVRADAAWDALSYALRLPGFEIVDSASGVSLQVGAIALRSEGVSATEAGLMKVGTSTGSLAALRLRAAGNGAAPAFEATLSDLSFEAGSSVEGNLLFSSTRLRGRGAIGSATQGSFDTTLAMRRIRAPTYERLLANALLAKASCYTGNQGPTFADIAQQAQADLVELLPFNPEIAIEPMQVDIGGVRGEMSASLGVRGVVADDARVPPEMLLLTRGNASFAAKVPVEWIQSMARQASARSGGAVPDPAAIDAMLDRAASQNFLVRDGAFVKTSLYYTNQKLVVNGKRISLDGR